MENEIKTKFEIAKILVETLNVDSSKALTPLYKYFTEQLALCSVVGQSEQLTFKCDLCQDDGVMIDGMDCTCKAAPRKS